MRVLACLLVLPLFFDVTPAGSLRKLGEKKGCSFTLELAIEGDVPGPFARAVESKITGAYEKPDVLSAKNGPAQTARRGTVALFSEDGRTWKTKDEIEKDRKAQSQGGQGNQNQNGPDPIPALETTRLPQDEIARALTQASLARTRSTAKAGNVECTVFEGALTKDAAAAMAKELVAGISVPTGGGGGGGRVPGGNGPNVPGGGGNRGSMKVKDARGGARLLVGSTDELPYELLAFVSFETDVPRNGQTQETTVTLKRTLTLAEFDAAKVQIPDDVKKRLGIKDSKDAKDGK